LTVSFVPIFHFEISHLSR